MYKILLICGILLARYPGCNQEHAILVPPFTPPNYPYVLQFSQERYVALQNAWSEFADSFGLSHTLPAIDSVNMVPRGEFSANIFYGSTDTITFAGAEERVLGVIDRWHLLFNAFSTDLVMRSRIAGPNPSDYLFTFEKQFNGRSNPTGLNIIQVSIQHDGTASFTTACAPTVLIPAIVNITAQQALQAVQGKTLIYYDWTGKKTDTVSAKTVKSSLVTIALIPRYASPDYHDYLSMRSVEYRNCWQLSTEVFHVYVDAVTGEDVNFAQQYIIF